MTLLQAIVLGVVQGVTEFLPISSTGHLSLVEKLWHISDGGQMFVILLHFGSLLAVIYAMRNQLKWLYKHPKSRLTWMILIALLPTAVVGALCEEWFDDLFSSGATLGLEFIITGIVLWWMDSCAQGKKTEDSLSTWDSLWIGALQGVALLPALSRSGLTIAGGLWRGMDREAAARFSFLLSIPAILGATVMKLDDLLEHPLQGQGMAWGPMVAGVLAAMVAGYLAIHFTLWLLRHSRMRIFAVYVWALAAFVLTDQLVFHHWFGHLL